MEFSTLILVGLGGAVGAFCRMFLITAIEKRYKNWLFTGTFFVNCMACFIAGLCMVFAADAVPHAIFAVGFCGGFSTLSAVNLDAAKYLQTKSTILSAAGESDGSSNRLSQRGSVRCFSYLILIYASALLSATAGFLVACSLA